MKLLAILLFLVLQIKFAEIWAQNVTIRVKQTEIRKVLTAFEKQTDIRFLYNYDLHPLKNKVDFAADNLPLCQALDKLLLNSGLTYKKVNENLIAVLSENGSENKAIRVTGKITGEA